MGFPRPFHYFHFRVNALVVGATAAVVAADAAAVAELAVAVASAVVGLVVEPVVEPVVELAAAGMRNIPHGTALAFIELRNPAA
jgi:hypothetical protein